MLRLDGALSAACVTQACCVCTESRVLQQWLSHQCLNMMNEHLEGFRAEPEDEENMRMRMQKFRQLWQKMDS